MDMTRRPDYCGGEEHVLESFIVTVKSMLL
jgi:hypothetical protein